MPTHKTSIRFAPSAAQDEHRPGDERPRGRAWRRRTRSAPRRGHDGDHPRADQEPVGRRVEHLAERRDLVEPAGHEAVDPVGGPEHGQQDGGRRLAAGPEQQPHEQREAEQADERDRVRDRQDPVEARLVGLDGSAGTAARLVTAETPVRPSDPESTGDAVGLRRADAVCEADAGGAASNPSGACGTTRRPCRWARSSPRPTTSSDRPSGSGWPTATRPTRCSSSCPSPTSGRASTSTSGRAALFASWIEHHVLVATRRPSLYPYRMTTPDGRSTTGVIGALAHRRRRPAPRRDDAQAAERPARPAPGDEGQPLPDLGALAHPGADRDVRAEGPAGGRGVRRRRRAATSSGWSTTRTRSPR